VDAALAVYRFNDAANALYAHVWGVYCDWYVEFAKPLLLGDDAAAQAETRATAAWAFDQCLILTHPIMPFITEELWGRLGAGRQNMLVHTDWPAYAAADLADPDADAEMGWTVKLIEAIRSVRAEMNVPPGAEIEMVMTGFSMEAAQRLLRNSALIQRLARLSECAVADRAPQGSITVAVEDATVCLPLAGVIDVAAETARLGKALKKIEGEIGGLTKKLANEAFLSKAPEAVVAENRERLVSAQAEAAALRAAAARVAALA
jgi:valyl-tRNA synthetase